MMQLRRICTAQQFSLRPTLLQTVPRECVFQEQVRQLPVTVQQECVKAAAQGVAPRKRRMNPGFACAPHP